MSLFTFHNWLSLVFECCYVDLRKWWNGLTSRNNFIRFIFILFNNWRYGWNLKGFICTLVHLPVISHLTTTWNLVLNHKVILLLYLLKGIKFHLHLLLYVLLFISSLFAIFLYYLNNIWFVASGPRFGNVVKLSFKHSVSFYFPRDFFLSELITFCIWVGIKWCHMTCFHHLGLFWMIKRI